jgi:hypothetical protein
LRLTAIASHRGGEKMSETFTENLMRAAVAELHFLAGMTAAREMFGKSCFSLGLGEKAAVDQAVLAGVGSNYAVITREWLAGQQAQNPVGFVRTPKAST